MEEIGLRGDNRLEKCRQNRTASCHHSGSFSNSMFQVSFVAKELEGMFLQRYI